MCSRSPLRRSWPRKTGGLTGSVANDVGTPIAGARINAQGPMGPVATTSDETGNYRFPRLAPGGYTVTASFEGFTTPR